jgi:hypothetical protein
MMRKFKERMKECTCVPGGKGITLTSTARCSSMLKEADDFGKNLTRCNNAIISLKNASEEIYTTTKSVMTGPLPRVYEDTAVVAGGEVKALEPVGGSEFQGDVVSKASLTANQRIESEVLVPMKRWSDALISLKARLHEVDMLRLELDSRRRQVAGLSVKVDKQRGKLTKKAGDSKMEAVMDQTIKKLQHKEGKLQIATSNFEENEASLYRDVSSLIKDAAWLKHYVASAMCIESEALGQAHSAFGKIAFDQDNTASAAASRPASVVTASQDAPNFGTNPSSLSPTGSTSSGGGGAPQP